MVTYSIRVIVRAVCWLTMCLLLAYGVTGCANIPWIGGQKTNGKLVQSIWTSGEQFVAIEKQDSQTSGTLNMNEHLSEISVDRIRAILESMELRAAVNKKAISLFNEDELKILSEYIPVGLALANPDEDVTFAVIGHYISAAGFLRQRMVTTGRVFCQDGQLNIIFGDIHRLLGETMGIRTEERRIHPFLPGARMGSVGVQEGMLLSKPGGEIFARNRPDWVVFQLKPGTEGQPITTVAQESEETAPKLVVNTGISSPSAPKAVTPQQKYSSESTTTQNTASMVTKRNPGYAGRDVNAYSGLSLRENRPERKKSIEERFIILHDLHNKRLITDEEYQEKRISILGDL